MRLRCVTGSRGFGVAQLLALTAFYLAQNTANAAYNKQRGEAVRAAHGTSMPWATFSMLRDHDTTFVLVSRAPLVAV
jgi:hypothetical protein